MKETGKSDMVKAGLAVFSTQMSYSASLGKVAPGGVSSLAMTVAASSMVSAASSGAQSTSQEQLNNSQWKDETQAGTAESNTGFTCNDGSGNYDTKYNHI